MSEIENLSDPFYYIITTKNLDKIVIESKHVDDDDNFNLNINYVHQIVLNDISKKIKNIEDEVIELTVKNKKCYVIIDSDIYKTSIHEDDPIPPYSRLEPDEESIYKELCKVIGSNKLEKLESEKKKYDNFVDVLKGERDGNIDKSYEEIKKKIESGIEGTFKNRAMAMNSFINTVHCNSSEIAELRSQMNRHILSLLNTTKNEEDTKLPTNTETDEENTKLDQSIETIGQEDIKIKELKEENVILHDQINALKLQFESFKILKEAEINNLKGYIQQQEKYIQKLEGEDD